jgi:tyrosine-protein phosphatase SIW14
MRIVFRKYFFLFSLACLAALPGLVVRAQSRGAIGPATMGAAPGILPAEKIKIAGISNAGKVDNILYRGAQPQLGAFQRLKTLGVSVVVDLHNTGADQSAEHQTVEALGMRYVSLPASKIYGPTDEQVAQFLALVRQKPFAKIFVHCNLGADRTGVMVAAYRMVQQQWSADQAYNEMRLFHYHIFLLPMGHYVKYFPEHFQRESAFAPLRSGKTPE